MTSHDVRDMLDLPGSGPRPSKKLKAAAPRTNLKGLAREVQSLGGDNPIAIVPEVSVFKKRRLAGRKPTSRWESKPFANSARADGLQLKHWRKKDDVPLVVPEDGSVQQTSAPVVPIEDSTFAKFNVQVNIPQYNDEEYNEHLENEDWARDETDYLMELVKDFDLRWPIIWDRYDYKPPIPSVEVAEGAVVSAEKVRTLEDLKGRYYRIAAAMMKVRKPLESMNAAEFDMYEKMKNFNPAQETKRKAYAETFFNRTKEEAKEEESLLLELKRILARSEKMSEERKELYARLEAPSSQGNIGIYSSSQGLQSLLHQLMQADKSKKRRSIMETGSGISPAAGPGQQPGFDRRESSIRESISGPSGAGNKKGGAQGPTEHRQLSAEDEALYGITHPTDRSTSGPIFRREKLNKLISSKSTAQQLKITNVLTEIGVGRDLIMPTADIGVIWTSLLEGILKMLELQRQVEKVDGELKVIRQQKSERDKKERAARGEPEPTAEPQPTENTEPGSNTKEVEQSREVSVQRSVRAASVQRSVRGASASHKRSASVLSVASDTGTKRQKK